MPQITDTMTTYVFIKDLPILGLETDLSFVRARAFWSDISLSFLSALLILLGIVNIDWVVVFFVIHH